MIRVLLAYGVDALISEDGDGLPDEMMVERVPVAGDYIDMGTFDDPLETFDVRRVRAVVFRNNHMPLVIVDEYPPSFSFDDGDDVKALIPGFAEEDGE